jgi:hypothetical protein
MELLVLVARLARAKPAGLSRRAVLFALRPHEQKANQRFAKDFVKN